MPMFCGTVYPNLPTGLWTIHRNYNQVVSHRERQWLGWCLCFVGQFGLGVKPDDDNPRVPVMTWNTCAFTIMSFGQNTFLFFTHACVSVCVCVRVFLVCVFSVCACVCVGGVLFVSMCVCLCVCTCVFVEHSHLFGVLIEKQTVQLCVELWVARVYSGFAFHTQLHAAVCFTLGYYLLKLFIFLSFCQQNTSFVATKVCLLWQNYVCIDKTVLSWQK